MSPVHGHGKNVALDIARGAVCIGHEDGTREVDIERRVLLQGDGHIQRVLHLIQKAVENH